MGSPYVDYEEHAHRYHVHRALAPEALNAWGEFVRPHAMPGGRMLDCGAGTCLFGAAWRSWARRDVIAVDSVSRDARRRGPHHRRAPRAGPRHRPSRRRRGHRHRVGVSGGPSLPVAR